VPPPPEPDPAAPLRPVRPRWAVYAERPRRRARQFVADVAVLTWVAVVVSLAIALHELVLNLQGPGRDLGAAGAGVRDTFNGAAETASGVPFVGDDLAGALSGGTRAGDSLVTAGAQEVAAIDALASGLAWAVVLLAVLPVLAVWVTLRVRWMIAARAVIVLRDGVYDADLLALRALTLGSPRRLARRVPDAADGWRRGDPHVLARLADLELGRLGLQGPSMVRAPVPPPDQPQELPTTLPRVNPEEGWGDTPPPPGPPGGRTP
jgi:hypothetical protein